MKTLNNYQCLEVFIPMSKEQYYVSSFNKASKILGVSYQTIINEVTNYSGWVLTKDKHLPARIKITQIDNKIKPYLDKGKIDLS